MLALALFYLRLSVAPVSFGRLPERIADALATRIGPGWTVALRNTTIELRGGSPALRASGLDIRDPNGTLVVRAPDAIVSVDGWSLLTVNLQPRSIELRDLQIRASVANDGSLTFISEPSSESHETPSVFPSASQQATPPIDSKASDASPVSRIVGSLFDLIVGPSGVLNSLDRAQLTNARLTLFDSHQKERAAFRRLDATFTRDAAGGHHFEAALDGPQGLWHLNGSATKDENDQYRATMVAHEAPLQDVLLLAGLSSVPANTDLKLSGRVDAAYGAGRVTELKARLDSKSGIIQIDDKDTSPLPVDHSTISVAWDEVTRVLNLNTLELKGGDTHVKLQGQLSPFVSGIGWHLSLNGRDAVLSGAASGDEPVRLSDIAADLSGPDGLALNFIRLRGPDVSLDMSGLLLSSADPKAIKLALHGVDTNVRSAVRIWPEAVAPPVRRFLLANLKAGTVEDINLKVDMTGADVMKSVSDGPIPDGSLDIAFSIAQATLVAAEGLPPIAQTRVAGNVTGTTVTLRAPSGQVEMADARSLAASDGSFALRDYWNDDAVAEIKFRLTGGADGLGALLLAPRIHEITGFDVDPAAMKGTVDLHVGIGLAVNNVPAFVDLPITVNGTVNDLSIDKLFGKDRLDGANLTLAYDQGNLSINGDGKLAGSPASIDVHRTKEGGEANVSFVLDEAARARRGLSFGTQLMGPLAIKASLPIGNGAKPGIRLEADLTKAGIDQLLPGWVKPAGRSGKVNLTIVDGPATEIRDLQLDSGPVQIRGTALFSSDGSLDKADLTTFKLSPGDDMRAQLDRTNGVYKVQIRGNVGDARPFTKTLSSSPQPLSGRASTSQPRESKDFDLDLALNILTGYNDEAITNAVVKASIRKENIRQLDVKGRLGATNIVSRTIPQAGGPPVILLQADDAGALLRFLDIYRRMSGGDLAMQMSTSDGPQTGTLTTRSFTLTNEPALRRIIPTQTRMVVGQDALGRPKTVQVDTNRVDFTKARVDFTRNAGRLEFKDAAIWGASIGFTLGGYIDYVRDRIDISGTFVPAYGLNNAFAQVPFFGPLLGGSQYEGLFAVNFRVSGQASSPTLMVNPLSAVAPGFLRKLFGAGGTSQAENPTPIPVAPER